MALQRRPKSLSALAVGEILARTFTGVVIIAQACLLDYFMVSCKNSQNNAFSVLIITTFAVCADGSMVWLGWVAADIIVLVAFTTFNFLAVRYFYRGKKTETAEIGLLPYAFVTWNVYSVVLAAKVATMFKTFARDIPADGWMGTTTMKIAIGLAAGIFALIIAGHHRSGTSERHKFCLKWMQVRISSSLARNQTLIIRELDASRGFSEGSPRILLTDQDRKFGFVVF